MFKQQHPIYKQVLILLKSSYILLLTNWGPIFWHLYVNIIHKQAAVSMAFGRGVAWFLLFNTWFWELDKFYKYVYSQPTTSCVGPKRCVPLQDERSLHLYSRIHQRNTSIIPGKSNININLFTIQMILFMIFM